MKLVKGILENISKVQVRQLFGPLCHKIRLLMQLTLELLRIGDVN